MVDMVIWFLIMSLTSSKKVNTSVRSTSAVRMTRK